MSITDYENRHFHDADELLNTNIREAVAAGVDMKLADPVIKALRAKDVLALPEQAVLTAAVMLHRFTIKALSNRQRPRL